jgi:hypothetical protein
MKRIAILTLLALTASVSADDIVPSPTTSHADKLLGVGFKLGDGIGFYGADVIVSPLPHVAVDLYGTVVRMSATSPSGMTQTGTGYAAAPAIQYHLFAGNRSTPYAAIGLQYVHLTLGDVTGSGTGGFVNAGYEWKWQSGLGIELGGGVQYIQKVEATNGTTTLTMGGKAAPNLEFGIRYRFL